MYPRFAYMHNANTILWCLGWLWSENVAEENAWYAGCRVQTTSAARSSTQSCKHVGVSVLACLVLLKDCKHTRMDIKDCMV